MKNRITSIATIICVLVLAVCGISTAPMQVQAAEYNMCRNRNLIVDGNEIGEVPCLDYGYDNAIYVSLKSVAYGLSGTEKRFSVGVTSEEINIVTGKNYSNNPLPFAQDDVDSKAGVNLKKHDMYVDDKERSYYTLVKKRSDGSLDCFITLMDVAMILDITIDMEDGNIVIDSTKPFSVSGEDMESDGFLEGVNALLIGDGTTGEIYYAYDDEKDFAIASTTKLITYYVLMDAVKAGEISLDDMVEVPYGAALLSENDDKCTPLKEGQLVSMHELLIAMLLPSSNECAYTIACHVAGSEKVFVERMNKKAEELGLTSTRFVNSHGLPFYDEQFLFAKKQNHMSADDMFTMMSHLLDDYPEIYDITSIKETRFDTLEYVYGEKVKNLNYLLYNIPEVKGLKTGTTNRAGCCLVTAMPVEKDGVTHNLIVVLFGAETSASRIRISEVAARYALSVFRGEAETGGASDDGTKPSIPENPELVAKALVSKYMSND